MSTGSRRAYDRRVKTSPLVPADANAFSISSIHKTTGASFCANSKVLCSFFSLSPTNLSYNAPRVQTPAHRPTLQRLPVRQGSSASLHARNQNPLGRLQPESPAFNVNALLRFRDPVTQASAPATSSKDVSRRPSRSVLRFAGLALCIEHGIEQSGIYHIPTRHDASAAMRIASSLESPARFRASWPMPAGSNATRKGALSAFSSASTPFTPGNNSSDDGKSS